MTARMLLSLGDSIALGGPILDGSPDYTQLIQARRRPSHAIGVVNAGVGGDTSAGARSRWDAQCKGRGFTHIVICVGTNSLAAGIDWPAIVEDIDSIRASAQEDRSGSASGIDVTILGVPPRGGSAGWDATKEARRLALNAALRDLHDVTFVDLDEALGGSGDPLELDPAFDCGDRLHPNGAGHVAIADAIDAEVPW